jgi:hypothetical protein
MRLIAISELHESVKAKILPAGNAEARSILGSKQGQLALFEACEVPYPTSYLLSLDSTEPDLSNLDSLLVKGDRHGGGRFVRQFPKAEDLKVAEIPRDWFPILIQEKLAGTLISVEALYSKGELVFWLYSEVNTDAYEFGPSISRRFLEPSGRDFVPHLQRLGKKGALSGAFNIGLVRNDETNTHRFFEFDARPNIWHHLFRTFKLDLASALTGKTDIPLHPKLAESILFYEPQRFFNDRAMKWRILDCVRVLRGKAISGYGQPMVNSFYGNESLTKNWIRAALLPLNRFRRIGLKLAIRSKALLPAGLRRRLDGSAIKRFTVGLFID